MTHNCKLHARHYAMLSIVSVILVFVTGHARGSDIYAQALRASGDANVSNSIQSIPSLALGKNTELRSGLDGEPFCRTDFSSDESRRASKAYRDAVRNGTLSRAPKGNVLAPEIGDERSFNVLEAGWESRTFRLMDKTSKYYLWMDVLEIPSHPGFSGIDFRYSMMQGTPAGSIDPQSGMMANNENIFGPPPNYDGDGITDILIYDMSDGGGYVISTDVWPGAPEGSGNQADVLYIDSEMSETSMAEVAAHEYVHLIQQGLPNYGGDYTFLTEGFAEYGMVLNGVGRYPFWYLTEKVDVQQGEGTVSIWEYEQPLYSWRYLESLDYQRANAFFSYVADHFDPQIVGEMLQGNPSDPFTRGEANLEWVLNKRGTTLGAVLRDFHAANLLNSAGVDERFSYDKWAVYDLGTQVTRQINGENGTPDGTGELLYRTVEPGRTIRPGAASYIRWSNVADFSITLDALGFQATCANPNLPPFFCTDRKANLRGPLRGIIVGTRPDASQEFWEINARDESFHFDGRFTALTAVITHTSPEASTAQGDPQFLYSAVWTPLSQVTATQDISPLPESIALLQNYPNPFNPRTTVPFQIDRSSNVRLVVYDMLGRVVTELVNDVLPAGSYEQQVDASRWPSGTYIVRLELNGSQVSRMMQLLK